MLVVGRRRNSFPLLNIDVFVHFFQKMTYCLFKIFKTFKSQSPPFQDSIKYDQRNKRTFIYIYIEALNDLWFSLILTPLFFQKKGSQDSLFLGPLKKCLQAKILRT